MSASPKPEGSEKIVQAGDPVLRKTAKAVPEGDFGSARLANLIERMKAALAEEPFGVAIAAPQVGAPVRLFVVAGKAFLPEEGETESGTEGGAPQTEDGEESGAKKETPPDMVFINPKITRLSKKKREMSEGCLSVRGKYGTVLRHERATVAAQDEAGKPFTYHGSGLIAHIFQHECDHLDGTLFVDKAVRLENEKERQALREKFPPGEKVPQQKQKKQRA